MLTSIAVPAVQFAAPAIRQGARVAIRIGTAGVVLYAAAAAVALVGYSAYLGSMRTRRGASSAYTWAGNKVRRTPLAIQAPAAAGEPQPATA